MIDVRAPIEFEHGHIPGAINVPLFNNEERAQIGTRYKHNGREAAIELGLKLGTPKKADLVAAVSQACQNCSVDKARIHCWRGGMRSDNFAQLIVAETSLSVSLLDGGYKSFRAHARFLFQQSLPLLTLSGLTGAGKTIQLLKFREVGEQVIDLEGLANHRGSSFGGIGQACQPSTEQFENELAWQLMELDWSRHIWIEDESRRLGKVVVPPELFQQINGGPAIFMHVPRERRAKIALADYGGHDIGEMTEAIHRIAKRLGPQHAKSAIAALNHSDLELCCEILLDYYDRTYLEAKSRQARDLCWDIEIEEPGSDSATQVLIALAEENSAAILAS